MRRIDELFIRYENVPTRFTVPRNNIEKIIYSKELKKLFSCGRDHVVNVWDPKGYHLETKLEGHDAAVLNLQYIPECNQLFTTSMDRSIIAWDDIHFKQKKRFPTFSPQLCLTYNHINPSILYSGGTDGMIHSYEIVETYVRRPVKFKGHTDYVMDMFFIHELNCLVSGSMDKTIRFWDIRKQKKKDTRYGHHKGVNSLAYAKFYRFILSAACEKELFVWSTLAEKPLHTFKGHTDPLVGVHAFESSPQVISVDVMGKVFIWDIRNFRCIQKLIPPFLSTSINSSSSNYNASTGTKSGFSQSRSHVTNGNSNILGTGNNISLGTNGFNSLNEYQNGNPCSCFCYDNINNQIITSGYKEICYWKSIDFAEDRKIKQSITKIRYNSLLDIILTVSGKDVIVWSVRTGEFLNKFGVGESEITDILLSSHQRDFICSTIEGEILVCSAQSGKIHREIHIGDEIVRIFHVNKYPRSLLEKISSRSNSLLLVATSKGSMSIVDLEKEGSEAILYNWTIHLKQSLISQNPNYHSLEGNRELKQTIEPKTSNSLQYVSIQCVSFSQAHNFLAVCIRNHIEMHVITTGGKKIITLDDISEFVSCTFVDEWNCFITVDDLSHISFWSIPNFKLLVSLDVSSPLSSLYSSRKQSTVSLKDSTSMERGTSFIIQGDHHQQKMERESQSFIVQGDVRFIDCSPGRHIIILGFDRNVVSINVEPIISELYKELDRLSISGIQNDDNDNDDIKENRYIVDKDTSPFKNYYFAYDKLEGRKCLIKLIRERGVYDHELGIYKMLGENNCNFVMKIYQSNSASNENHKECSPLGKSLSLSSISIKDISVIEPQKPDSLAEPNSLSTVFAEQNSTPIDINEFYSIIFEPGTQCLQEIMSSHVVLTKSEIRWMIECIARSLKNLHSVGICMTQLRPSNIAKFQDNYWKLINLQYAQEVGKEKLHQFSDDIYFFSPEMAAQTHQSSQLITEIGTSQDEKDKWRKGETRRGNHVVSIEAQYYHDMWAFGIIIYELLTKRRYYDTDLTREDILKIICSENIEPLETEDHQYELQRIQDITLKVLLQKLLVKDPKKRWDIDQVIEYLEATGGCIGDLLHNKQNSKSSKLKSFPSLGESFVTSAAVEELFKPITFDLSKGKFHLLKEKYTLPQGSDISNITVISSPDVIFCSYFSGDEGKVSVFSLDGFKIGSLSISGGFSSHYEKKINHNGLDMNSLINNKEEIEGRNYREEIEEKENKWLWPGRDINEKGQTSSIEISKESAETPLETSKGTKKRVSYSEQSKYITMIEKKEESTLDSLNQDSLKISFSKAGKFEETKPGDMIYQTEDPMEETEEEEEESFHEFDSNYFEKLCPFFYNLGRHGVNITPIIPFYLGKDKAEKFKELYVQKQETEIEDIEKGRFRIEEDQTSRTSSKTSTYDLNEVIEKDFSTKTLPMKFFMEPVMVPNKMKKKKKYFGDLNVGDSTCHDISSTHSKCKSGSNSKWLHRDPQHESIYDRNLYLTSVSGSLLNKKFKWRTEEKKKELERCSELRKKDLINKTSHLTKVKSNRIRFNYRPLISSPLSPYPNPNLNPNSNPNPSLHPNPKKFTFGMNQKNASTNKMTNLPMIK